MWTSSRDGHIGDGATFGTSALSTGTHVIHAAVTDSGGKSAESTVTVVVDATPTVSITAPASGSTYEPGQAVALTATANDPEHGSLTAQIAWTSDRDGSLGTSGSLSITSLTSGTHLITASATEVAGKTGHATITVVVNATPVVTITAPANNTSPEPGAAVVFSATATDAEQGNLAASVAWTSDGQPLGTGASITVGTLPAGTHTITAAVTDNGGKTGTASIQVHVNATPTISITGPASNSVYEPGVPVAFTGTAHDAEQGDLSADITWTSNHDGVLGSGAGLTVSTLSAGTHTIVASVSDAGGKSATTAITVVVNATPTVDITTPAANTNFEPGADATFTASANDPEDGTLSNIAWSSNHDGALGTGSSITIHTLTTGTHVITAAATDSGGKTGLATVTVTVDASPVVTIDAPAAGTNFQPGASATFTAHATDAEAGDVSTSLTWTSDLDGAIGAGASISVSTLSTGTHVITATAGDGTGKTGSATVMITVDAAPTLEITAPASGSTHEPGATVTFVGTATDPEDGLLTASIAWSSDRDGGLGIGGSVSSSTLSAGTHTITASAIDSRGNTGTTTITIDVLP